MSSDRFWHQERDHTEVDQCSESIYQEVMRVPWEHTEASAAIDEAIKAYRLANEQLVDAAAQMEDAFERNRVKIAELERGRDALLAQAQSCATRADTARYRQQLAAAKSFADSASQARTQADKLSEMIDQLSEENTFTEESFEEALLVMSLAEAKLDECHKVLPRAEARFHGTTTWRSEVADRHVSSRDTANIQAYLDAFQLEN